MTFRTSVLWKMLLHLAKKWPEILVKWPTPSFVIFVSKQSLPSESVAGNTLRFRGKKQYIFQTKFFPLEFEGILYNSDCLLLGPWFKSRCYKFYFFSREVQANVWCKKTDTHLLLYTVANVCPFFLHQTISKLWLGCTFLFRNITLRMHFKEKNDAIMNAGFPFICHACSMDFLPNTRTGGTFSNLVGVICPLPLKLR